MTSFTGWAIAQPTRESTNQLISEICESSADVQAIVKRLKDCEVDQKEIKDLRERLVDKDNIIKAVEKELALEKKDTELLKREKEIFEKQVQAMKDVFNQLKEVTDRAMEMAKISKKSTWEQILEWVIRLTLFVVGVFVGRM